MSEACALPQMQLCLAKLGRKLLSGQVFDGLVKGHKKPGKGQGCSFRKLAAHLMLVQNSSTIAAYSVNCMTHASLLHENVQQQRCMAAKSSNSDTILNIMVCGIFHHAGSETIGI